MHVCLAYYLVYRLLTDTLKRYIRNGAFKRASLYIASVAPVAVFPLPDEYLPHRLKGSYRE